MSNGHAAQSAREVEMLRLGAVCILGTLLMAGAMMTGLETSEIGRGDRDSGTHWATRSPVIATHGMAATAHPLATQIAIDILKHGGSAVDAAIAANAALGLMEPVSCGIGGDLFAIVWDPKTHRLYGLNGSGRSALGRDLPDLLSKLKGRTHIPPRGSLPVTVPGTVDAWFEMHQRFGRLPVAEDLAPAIAYAREGFPVSQLIAAYWASNMAVFEKSFASKELEEIVNARTTYLVNGHSPGEGEIFKNPDLAATYEKIAKGGRDAFYGRDIARTVDAYMKRIGGDLRLEDFAAHKSTWIDPVTVSYRGYTVAELPPNGQGISALQMLKVLEGFDLKSMGAGNPAALHVMIEAKRLAFEDLARYYADPAFSPAPIQWLISDKYAAERRALIKPDRALTDIGPGEARLKDGDTTYLTVADKAGMMVSLIQSNYRGMGSGLVADHLGFMLQDRGELFALTPGHPNVYAPGKRPFHTIIPGFLLKDDEPLMSFGVMGGDMQPQGHVQVLTNIIDFGMNLQVAGDAARWRHYGSSEPTGDAREGVGTVTLENGFPPETRKALEKMGHRLAGPDGSFGGYQAIWRDPRTHVYYGASEMRKDGQAQGY
jgi:gamma-glutamyltranspeptidase / glutathione hydrolase